ncbi:MAG: class I tRNA ligase family protein [Acholeplasmatales bacterium]|nr:class I tRNA ligase family protein [Acholeplasmatales bacterium]
MNYDELYKSWQESNLFSLDRDRLKKKKYVYSSIPYANTYGFQTGRIRPILAGDLMSRYLRMQNYNVLYPLGFNTLCNSSFLEARKMKNKLDDTITNYFKGQMLKLGVGIDEGKLMDMRHDEYLSNLQESFIEFYENGFIEYKTVNVYKENNKIYDSHFRKSDDLVPQKAFVLKLDKVIDNIISDILNLNIDITIKKELISFFEPKDLLELKFMSSTGYELPIMMDNPELLGGISFVFLNPDLMDAEKFIDKNEISDINLALNDDILYQYTGNTLKNPLTGLDIPIFISKIYNKDIYLGIPGFDNEDRAFSESEGFEVIEILDENKKLINSDFLNGLELKEANQRIIDTFLEYGIARTKTFYEHDEVLLSQLDNFGALFPFLDDRGKLYSIKNFLPFKFSQQFRPILDPDIDVPGVPIPGSMNSLFSVGMAPFIGIMYDEVQDNEPIFSEVVDDEFNTFFPIEELSVDSDNIYQELFMPIAIHNIIRLKMNIPPLFKNVKVYSRTLDIKRNEIVKSNVNLIDFDSILETISPDAIRISALYEKSSDDYIFDKYQIEDLNKMIISLYEFLNNSEDIENNPLINNFTNKAMKLLDENKIEEYVKLVVSFINETLFTLKLNEDDILTFLRVIHPIMPFISEDLYNEIYNRKYSILTLGWPY